MPVSPCSFATVNFLGSTVSRMLARRAALTALVVLSQLYPAVRKRLVELNVRLQSLPPNHLSTHIQELHAQALLSDWPQFKDMSPTDLDDKRIEVLVEAIEIVNAHRLPVLHCAYTNTKAIRELDRGADPKLYSLNLLGVLSPFGPLLARGLVVPVMDGVPGTKRGKASVDPVLIRAFARVPQSYAVANACGIKDSGLNLPNSQNLVETFFVDSAHSPLVQLADLVAYMLLARYQRSHGNVSSFKRRIADVGDKLDPSLLRIAETEMKIQGLGTRDAERD
jgi:hypothetical protein